jgi:hypothetical protein
MSSESKNPVRDRVLVLRVLVLIGSAIARQDGGSRENSLCAAGDQQPSRLFNQRITFSIWTAFFVNHLTTEALDGTFIATAHNIPHDWSTYPVPSNCTKLMTT